MQGRLLGAGASPPARRALPVLLATLVSMLLPSALRAQLVVVVNAASSVEDISADRLKRLFLGQATTFHDGSHASLALHVPSSVKFDAAALGLGREVVRSRWMAMVFRGETAVLPPEYTTVEDVKKFVREHPDALAYLPLADADASVKVLRIDNKRPTDSGYPLR